MKTLAQVLLLSLLSASSARTFAMSLPPPCGDDKIKFDVKTQKDAPAPAGPQAGKAQLVFVESMDKGDKYHHCLGCDATTRVGIDGSWVGANHGDSYFTVSVDPGPHSVCVNWQSISTDLDSNVSLLDLNAEAGNVYYVQITVVVHEADNPNFSYRNMFAGPIPSDRGVSLVQKSALSSWTQKK